MKNPIPELEDDKLGEDKLGEPRIPMPGPGPVVPIEEQSETDGKAIGMWAAICLIVQAIAQNIKDADIIEMTNMFRMAFRSFLATIIVVGFGSLLYEIAMMPETDEAQLNRFVGVILGYVAGILTAAIGFYFGGQDRTKKPEESKPLLIGEEPTK